MNGPAITLRRPRRRLSSLLVASLLAAVLVNLLVFAGLARLLGTTAPSALPPVVEVSRQPPPPPPPAAEPAPPSAATPTIQPPAPPVLPQLDLGSADTGHGVVQSTDPIIAPLPALVPTGLAALPEAAGPAAAPEVPAVLDQDHLDQPVQALDHLDPVYPPQALRLGLADTVTVGFTVHRDGSVSDLALVSARHAELFLEPSLTCVHKARFIPGRWHGQPVDSHCTWTFHYVRPADH